MNERTAEANDETNEGTQTRRLQRPYGNAARGEEEKMGWRMREGGPRLCILTSAPDGGLKVRRSSRKGGARLARGSVGHAVPERCVRVVTLDGGWRQTRWREAQRRRCRSMAEARLKSIQPWWVGPATGCEVAGVATLPPLRRRTCREAKGWREVIWRSGGDVPEIPLVLPLWAREAARCVCQDHL